MGDQRDRATIELLLGNRLRALALAETPEERRKSSICAIAKRGAT